MEDKNTMSAFDLEMSNGRGSDEEEAAYEAEVLARRKAEEAEKKGGDCNG